MSPSFPERNLSQEYLSRPDLKVKQFQVEFMVKTGQAQLGYGVTIIKMYRGICIINVCKIKVVLRLWSIYFWSGGKGRKMTTH